uniref:Uncharacterized protein n=1 Tax=Chromera velia CCMP2878 TaxID=1169474 RepID=A0A0G4I6G9_9ALVE|eukprot:Cvel_11331.t1-p1 / transcript=Cvel_11331.t1 / gene=Cvel_11331 / organism=Chromera_velia_CCMP2878 / gene_product=hypothetical protein / transcript_product=hypothetical protein / location=Cvel_scaffold709:38682-40649(+) / protein_length=454 / sequence_SO=supercontig / SO=protein_coding / is_pseudo=false
MDDDSALVSPEEEREVSPSKRASAPAVTMTVEEIARMWQKKAGVDSKKKPISLSRASTKGGGGSSRARTYRQASAPSIGGTPASSSVVSPPTNKGSANVAFNLDKPSPSPGGSAADPASPPSDPKEEREKLTTDAIMKRWKSMTDQKDHVDQVWWSRSNTPSVRNTPSAFGAASSTSRAASRQPTRQETSSDLKLPAIAEAGRSGTASKVPPRSVRRTASAPEVSPVVQGEAVVKAAAVRLGALLDSIGHADTRGGVEVEEGEGLQETVLEEQEVSPAARKPLRAAPGNGSGGTVTTAGTSQDVSVPPTATAGKFLMTPTASPSKQQLSPLNHHRAEGFPAAPSTETSPLAHSCPPGPASAVASVAATPTGLSPVRAPGQPSRAGSTASVGVPPQVQKRPGYMRATSSSAGPSPVRGKATRTSLPPVVTTEALKAQISAKMAAAAANKRGSLPS